MELGSVVPTAYATSILVNGSPAAPTLTPSGTLLLSDDPETLTVGMNGRTYQDRVTGRFRVLDYHVNATGTALQVGIAFTAPSDGPPLNLFVNRHAGATGSSGDPQVVGQTALYNWLTSTPVDTYAGTIAPGTSLYFEQSTAAATPAALAVAMYDAVATDAAGNPQPVLVTTYAWTTAMPGYPTASGLPTLPAMQDPPARGTFPYHTLTGTFAPADATAPVGVAIGMGHEAQYGIVPLHGEYAQGIDATTGTPTWNDGNYGVLYDWTVGAPAPSGGHPSVATLINPRGAAARYAVITRGNTALYDDTTVAAQSESWVVDNAVAAGTYTLRFSLPAGGSAPNWLVMQAAD